jgi:hypothetical protein
MGKNFLVRKKYYNITVVVVAQERNICTTPGQTRTMSEFMKTADIRLRVREHGHQKSLLVGYRHTSSVADRMSTTPGTDLTRASDRVDVGSRKSTKQRTTADSTPTVGLPDQKIKFRNTIRRHYGSRIAESRILTHPILRPTLIRAYYPLSLRSSISKLHNSDKLDRQMLSSYSES